jgi:hypothetical protein
MRAIKAMRLGSPHPLGRAREFYTTTALAGEGTRHGLAGSKMFPVAFASVSRCNADPVGFLEGLALQIGRLR